MRLCLSATYRIGTKEVTLEDGQEGLGEKVKKIETINRDKRKEECQRMRDRQGRTGTAPFRMLP